MNRKDVQLSVREQAELVAEVRHFVSPPLVAPSHLEARSWLCDDPSSDRVFELPVVVDVGVLAIDEHEGEAAVESFRQAEVGRRSRGSAMVFAGSVESGYCSQALLYATESHRHRARGVFTEVGAREGVKARVPAGQSPTCALDSHLSCCTAYKPFS